MTSENGVDDYASVGHPRRWAILAVMCLSIILTGLDTLIVTIALPSIENQLGTSPVQLQWVVAAYSLAFAAPLLFAGAMIDRFGRRRGFILGLVVFLIGSCAAASAWSPAALISSRAVMGLGAASIMPATLSLIRHVFPAGERAKAMGIWVGMSSLGIPLGPIVGGALLEHFWWGSVFLINIPVVLIAIVAGRIIIPESRGVRAGGLDVVGLVLSFAGPLLIVFGIIQAPEWRLLSPAVLGSIVVGAILFAAFILWERRTSRPMLSRAVFEDRRFGGPLVTIATVFFCVFGGLFIVTQYLQFSLGYSPLEAGLHMLAICTAVLAAPIVPRLVQRFGLGPVSMFGPLLVAASMAVLAVGDSPSSTQVLIALGLMGLGIGFGAPPSVDSILAATPAEQSGAGSAVADVAMQFGGAFGIAIMGSAAAAATSDGMSAATTIGAAVGVVGAVVVVIVVPRTRGSVPAAPAGEQLVKA
ncbi:MFS transporter [Cellulomonas sp. URHD0024]|uniref:MFS transporter n=1 Tax=Cellulomonas sp. URHD0024 TaxID=1302620 RepID=UPI000408AE4F|nr:MFS transporter [Cellulomonas sp. URHD0024]